MFRAITKWNARIERPSIIPEVVRKAFKIAQTEKPGACHLELPEDVAAEEVEGSPLPSIRTRRPSPDRESLRTAARLIEEARNVIILAGNGVIRGKAYPELLRFSQQTGIAVAHTFMGKGAVPWYYELSLLSIGLQAHDTVSCGFDRADLIISVGYDLAEYAPFFWNPKGDKRIVHIDFTPSEIDEHYKTTVEIVADIRETLELLAQEVHGQKDTRYPKVLRDYIVNEYKEKAGDESFPMKPQKIIYDVRRVMGKSDLLISDVGAHKIWIARMYPVHEPNTCLISNGFAAMGFALPAAIAAKLVQPEQRVLVVCGDGGFMMNCQELETACRLKTPFVTLIFNDGGYGLIGWKQRRRSEREVGVSFTNPDFVKLADSFGAKGYRVERAKDLVPLLEEAFRQTVPAVIDLPVDYTENLRLTEKMGRLVCPI
jgi:acetolactate synthase-1/2/3 large subunit